MYSDWASLLPEIQSDTGDQSVLSRFSYATSREVVNSIVKNLSNMTKCIEGHEPSLLSDNDVNWTMEIICFGLSLSVADRDTTLECVNIYCEWTTCLVEQQRSVPPPLREEPNRYFCQMLTHLVNLFKPRSDTNAEYMAQHVQMCLKVLSTIQTVSSKSKLMTPESWISLLKFLLTVCDALLSPPSVKDDLGSQLCERMLSVLFETWLVSCSSGNFPSPSLWKTMHEMSLGWRHHKALVTQWHKINSLLTTQMLKMFYGPLRDRRSSLHADDCDTPLLNFASNDVIVQCWFRFLHLIGNPIDLSRPRVISNTQKFLHAALLSQDVVEPHQHECLKSLPLIFSKAMKSVSFISSEFLGLNQKDTLDNECLTSTSGLGQTNEQPTVTPPPIRKQQRTSFLPHIMKTNKDTSSRLSLGETWSTLNHPQQSITTPSNFPPVHTNIYMEPSSLTELSTFRPKVNSLLHLLGSWLFDASFIGVDVLGSSQKEEDWGNESMQPYEAGRAQACGTLCRIFCSVKTDEKVLHVYISRFYTVLYYGLKVKQDTTLPSVLISIILNSIDIFKVNLMGSQVLVPQYLKAIEFLQTKFRYKHDNVDEDGELRFATIQLLLSIVSLPLHFKHLEIKKILDDEKLTTQPITFHSLHPRITSLFLKLLHHEVDPINTQMLLGGIVLAVADMATHEEHSLSSEDSSQLFELYEKATVLICDRLIKSWTSELTSALASMEVLQLFSTLKSLKSKFRKRRENDDISILTNGVLEAISKKIVTVICDFVVHQCSKPAIYHSKDLHSSIVSAYQCLTTWLVEHNYLLQDGAILHTVLQVTELGISGTRSQPKPTDIPVYKGNKELKPVSLRVRDAAEALLATIVDHAGSFPSTSGPESLCTLLDEQSFLAKFNQQVGPKFQYFVIDGSVILGLFEPPPPSEETETPLSLVAVTRTSFGRRVWFLKSCHQTKLKDEPLLSMSDKPNLDNEDATTQGFDQQPTQKTTVPQYFPDSVSQVPPVLADLSIPQIEKTMVNYEEQLKMLRCIIDDQKKFENECNLNFHKNSKPPPLCEPPSSPKISNAARLFLSHFGFLTLDNLKGGSLTNSMIPTLIKLNSSDANLWNDLKCLDGMSVRTADTIHIYYAKHGQSKLDDLLTNVFSKDDVHPHFNQFLLSLGWPVDIEDHPGWTGNPATSWKVKNKKTSNKTDKLQTTGGSCYDGKNKVLYWADVTTELVFVVPSTDSVQFVQDLPPESSKLVKSSGTVDGDGNTGPQEGEVLKMRRSGRVGQGGGNDVQVVIVWLEHYEDHITFPIADLAKLSNHQQAAEFKSPKISLLNASHFCVIFVHPLNNGLFRVHLHQPPSRIGDAGPLVDGALVSKCVLGHMVRQTAYNIYRRKTLEIDTHLPSHLKRRTCIKEIIQRHKCTMSEPDFYTSFFQC